MKRILVPLDGTDLAASILPDARRLAGNGGELILVRDAPGIRYDEATGKYTDRPVVEETEAYLAAMAASLSDENVTVRTVRLAKFDVAWAIDGLARDLQVDMIACATHGRGSLGRLVWGSVAWRILVQSPVPVVLRHAEEDWRQKLLTPMPSERRIMLPLDGSPFAELAFPLAKELAAEWHSGIWLVRVVPGFTIADAPFLRWDTLPYKLSEELASARTYLERVASELPGEVHTEVLTQMPVGTALSELVRDKGITDVILASHGRTGVSWAILGSVARGLVHTLHIPILIIPAHATAAVRQVEGESPERSVVEAR